MVGDDHDNDDNDDHDHHDDYSKCCPSDNNAETPTGRAQHDLPVLLRAHALLVDA